MILIDASLLLYAHDPRATQHDASRTWFQSVLSHDPLLWGILPALECVKVPGFG